LPYSHRAQASGQAASLATTGDALVTSVQPGCALPARQTIDSAARPIGWRHVK